MDVIAMYDYYFNDRPIRKPSGSPCDFELCAKSIVYRRISTDDTIKRREDYYDVLEYMQYNVSGDTGLPSYYACCMNYDGGHVCNAIPLMVGSKLEKKLIARLCEHLDIPYHRLYDEKYLHRVYAATFLVNGTFYYSVFRESNNNKICHNTRSKFRGEETVAYFYDRTLNRGIKLFTGRNGELKVNDRDGKEISKVNGDTLAQLYKECLKNPNHYTLNVGHVTDFFSAVKRLGFSGIDSFKNKIYTNYTIGLNNCLDKLHTTVASHPMWNTSLMTGKVNIGISQRLSYPKTKSETKKQNEQKLKLCTGGMSTGYLVESQRRRNTRKIKQPKADGGETECGEDGPSASKKSKNESTATMFGSNVVKTNGIIEKLESCEKNGPTMFNQVTVPYLPFVRLLSSTVQKLQVEHVHAESSKTVPKDATGFICMKFVGNISTAGKNMLFTDRVRVSYGHVHEVVENVENALQRNADGLVDAAAAAAADGEEGNSGMRIVINNAVTVYKLKGGQRFLLDFMIWLKTSVHRSIWIKPIGDFVCVHFFEGVPLLEYERGESLFDIVEQSLATSVARKLLTAVECVRFTRNELELIRDLFCGNADETHNDFVIRMFRPRFCCISGIQKTTVATSSLALQLDQYTDYTPPSKRSVSVNSRKSACVNVYYQKAAFLIRGFSLFADPESYERNIAQQAYEQHGVPIRATLSQFRLMREDPNNCPQPQFDHEHREGGGKTIYNAPCDRYALRNFYMMRTIFADIDGFNVEDANVIDESVDLCLRFSYSFALTFMDKTPRGVDILIPPPEDSVRVCGWSEGGDPLAVLFMICIIRTDATGNLRFPNGELNRDDGTNECRKTENGVTAGNVDVHFPPFRKVSVIMNMDGSYHVYVLRNDAVLLRSIKRQRCEWIKRHAALGGGDYDPFGTVEEINPYHVLDSLRTRVSRCTTLSDGERVVTVDFRASGRVDKFDGIKVVNSFGQKGLALIRDLKPYFKERCYSHDAAAGSSVVAIKPATHPPVQLVMNVCSFVSRQPIGQFLQMKKNFSEIVYSAAGEPCLTGYSSVFFTETEPTTKTCLVRLDEMMRSVIITLGLSSFQNVKNSLDNVYNPKGLMCPPQTRQILNLYRCYGVAYNITGDNYEPYSTRKEVEQIFELFETCMTELQETSGKQKKKPAGESKVADRKTSRKRKCNQK